jgi:hypothetical protein
MRASICLNFPKVFPALLRHTFISSQDASSFHPWHRTYCIGQMLTAQQLLVICCGAQSKVMFSTVAVGNNTYDAVRTASPCAKHKPTGNWMNNAPSCMRHACSPKQLGATHPHLGAKPRSLISLLKQTPEPYGSGVIDRGF